MRFRNELEALYSEIEKLVVRDQHHIVDDAKFITIKDEILDVFKTLFGEASREFRVVKLTSSPATVVKVMNHIAARTETLTSSNIAVNM